MVNQKNGKGMTIKELKERIKDLPDDMEIAINDPEYECDDPWCGCNIVSVCATPINDEDVFTQHVTWMGEEKDVLTFGLIK